MERSELVELLSPEGLRLLDELPAYESTTDVVRTVGALRAAGHSPALVAAVLTQSRLRRKAASKFGEFADRMLFTEAGLEQASRLVVAARHAERFRAAGLRRVVDLGCGIGGDSLAMAALGLEATAIERDEVTAAVASFNLAPWPQARVLAADAEKVDLGDFDGVFADPARRREGRRLHDPDDWSPSLHLLFEAAETMPVGLKLGPALDRALIPDGCEAQWVSVDGETVELGLWLGALARPGIARAALLLHSDGTGSELSAAGDSPDEPVGPLGDWLYEPDGAVIRARLIGELARRIGAHPVSDSIAWLSGDDAVDTPFATRFRVLERLPFDEGKLKKRIAQLGIGALEIKKRGADVDPAALRRRLNPKGEAAATLIVTRIGGRHTAILSERA